MPGSLYTPLYTPLDKEDNTQPRAQSVIMIITNNNSPGMSLSTATNQRIDLTVHVTDIVNQLGISGLAISVRGSDGSVTDCTPSNISGFYNFAVTSASAGTVTYEPLNNGVPQSNGSGVYNITYVAPSPVVNQQPVVNQPSASAAPKTISVAPSRPIMANIKGNATAGNTLFTTINGVQVLWDYSIDITIGGYYDKYVNYPGGSSKFNDDLIKEITSELAISPRRISISNVAQSNSDLSISLIVNNNPPAGSTLKNDHFSAKCIFDVFVAFATNGPAVTCSGSGIIPMTFIGNVETFNEHLTILSSGTLTVTGKGKTPKNPVSVTAEPTSVFDYIFMYSYLFAIIGSILFSISTVMNISPASIIVNRNILVALDVYLGICGFISLCCWYQIDVPFNTFFNENVVKPKV